MHDASVDNLTILHKMDADFPCPSDKGEDEEEENNRPDRISANISGIFNRQIVFFLPKRIKSLRIQLSPDCSSLFYCFDYFTHLAFSSPNFSAIRLQRPPREFHKTHTALKEDYDSRDIKAETKKSLKRFRFKLSVPFQRTPFIHFS